MTAAAHFAWRAVSFPSRHKVLDLDSQDPARFTRHRFHDTVALILNPR